jgi:hypothetical protein
MKCNIVIVMNLQYETWTSYTKAQEHMDATRFQYTERTARSFIFKDKLHPIERTIKNEGALLLI